MLLVLVLVLVFVLLFPVELGLALFLGWRIDIEKPGGGVAAAEVGESGAAAFSVKVAIGAETDFLVGV